MKPIALVLFFIIVQCGNAQDSHNSKPAVIITHQNDSVPGVIKNTRDLSSAILFKANRESDYREYLPDNIVAFQFKDGYTFKSKPVSIEGAQPRQRFLLCLVEGLLSLYKYKSNYYLEKPAGSLTELSKKDTIINGYVFSSKRYQGLLRAFTVDCPSVQSTISKTAYNDEAIIKVVKAYNGCKGGSQNNVVYKRSRLKVVKGIKGGLSISDMKYTGEASIFYDEDFKPAPGFTMGGWINFSYGTPLSVQVEMLLTSARASLQLGRDDYQFSQTYLQWPVCVYYAFPFANVRPFVSGGFVFNYAVSQEAYGRVFDSYNQRYYTFPISLTRDELGVRPSAGVALNPKGKLQFRLEYIFERSVQNKPSSDRILNINDSRVVSTRHQLAVSIGF